MASDVECTVHQRLARALLSRETAAACVRQHLQCRVKQELLHNQQQRTGERGRLGRSVKQRLTGERKGGEWKQGKPEPDRRAAGGETVGG